MAEIPTHRRCRISPTGILALLLGTLFWAGITMPAHAAEQTIGASADAAAVAPGGSVTVTVAYTTSGPADETLTGLGLRVHYDGSKLQLTNVEVLHTEALLSREVVPSTDETNRDNDTSTTRFMHIAWLDPEGRWPGAARTPTNLFRMSFVATDTFSGETTLRFTSSGTAAGYTLAAGPLVIASTVTGDRTPPEITLLGAATIETTLGRSFVDPGATARDDRDGDISSQIVASGVVNTLAPGTYQRRYDVSDSAGNAATPRFRFVTVTGSADAAPPEISAPPAVRVELEAPGGVPRSSAQLANFFAAVRAIDNRDASVEVTNDAPATLPFGSTTVTFTARDAAGNTATATSRIDVIDTRPPTISVPSDIDVVAVGYLTPVDPGTARATATDLRDGGVSVTVTSGPSTTLLRPGRYHVSYSARDAAGNVATAQQTIRVVPLVQFGPAQQVGEGQRVVVPVLLNGEPPTRPVRVLYRVGGTATAGSDHTLSAGEVRIAEGLVGLIAFDVTSDDRTEGTETVTLEIAGIENAEAGRRRSITVDIVEANVPPVVELTVRQAERVGARVVRGGGTVVLRALVADPNTNDTFTYRWSSSPAVVVSGASDRDVFTFDPAGSDAGAYRITLRVTDRAGASTERDATVVVLPSAPGLGTADSDGDGTNDRAEGSGDADGDGIVDFLDNSSDRERLPLSAGAAPTDNAIEVDAGLRLALGAAALAASGSHATLSSGEFASFGDGGRATGATDASFNYPMPFFDFVIEGLPVGDTAAIVIPLASPIPAGTLSYRKFISGAFRAFTSDSRNSIASAPLVDGICPPPRSTRFTSGLVEGNRCIQLVLQDGGPNDADGRADGRILDPGSVAVGAATTQPTPSPAPAPASGGGGGGCSVGHSSSDPLLALLVVLAAFGAARRSLARWSNPRRRAVALAVLWATTASWPSTTVHAATVSAPDLKQLEALIAKHGRQAVIVRVDGAPIPLGVGVNAATAQSAMQRLRESQANVGTALARVGVLVDKRFDYTPFVTTSVDRKGLATLLATKGVVGVYEDRLLLPSLAESVPLIHGRATDTGNRRGTGHAVAILDTGVDSSHPFLLRSGANRVVREACFSTPDSSSTTLCPNGTSRQIGTGAARPCLSGCEHGTHVAGIAVGDGANFDGVASDADLIAVQVFQRSSGGNLVARTSDIIAALEHVLSLADTLRIAAVNMSLGGGQFASPCDNDPTKPVIDLLKARGVAVVVASGNSSATQSISSPACVSTAISVGATNDQTDRVAAFSNSASFLTLLAPGQVTTSSVPGGSFAAFQGTSMAAPHVAGAFAVLRQAAPTASVDELLGAMQVGGQVVIDSRNGVASQRIDVAAALEQLASAVGSGGFRVTPMTIAQSTGSQGEAAIPDRFTYDVESTAERVVPLVVSDDADWLDVAPSQGEIAAGARTQVVASLNAGARTLAPGDYVATIAFRNPETGRGNTSRVVRLSVRPPPAANDKFENAILLEASSGSTLGNSINASREEGEPLHAGNAGGASVWWRWRAAENGTVTFDTAGSSFDTLLAAYRGNVVAALTGIASNDDAIGLASRITFAVQAGTTYSIAVDGFSGDVGAITLNWNFVPTIERGGLTVSPDTGLAARGNIGGPFTPGSVGFTLTNTTTSDLDFRVSELPIWLTATPTSGRLQPSASGQVVLTVNANADTLPAGVYGREIAINDVRRAVSLTIGGAVANNDNFVDGRQLSGSLPIRDSADNRNATREQGEPEHARPGGASVWWRWTAPVGVPVLEVTTEGSDFDTTLGIYSGNAVDALTIVGVNDDGAGIGLASRVSFTPIAGRVYHIAVDGYFGATGNIQLNVGGSNAVDGTPPQLTLVGANPLAVTVGSDFADPGATAIDDRDGEITARVIATGDVDTNVLGDYLRRYDVSDSAGNAAPQLTRVVRIVDRRGADLDDNGRCEAFTDGVMLLRFLFGFRGEALTSDALASDAQRTDPSAIAARLEARLSQFDIDGIGGAQALTDGILIARHMLEFRGEDLRRGIVQGNLSTGELDSRLSALCR